MIEGLRVAFDKGQTSRLAGIPARDAGPGRPRQERAFAQPSIVSRTPRIMLRRFLFGRQKGCLKIRVLASRPPARCAA